MIKHGDICRDRITGFEGTVTAIISYWTGCDQASLVPRTGDDGKLKENEWFDVTRLEKVGEHPGLPDLKDQQASPRPGGTSTERMPFAN